MLKPRSILITGATRGIGRFLSECYALEGNLVFGLGRSQSDFEHPNYKHFICDITQESSINSTLREIKKSQKGLDILINNAGIASMNHSLLTPLSSVEKIFATNVHGTFIMMRDCARLLKNSAFPRVVNFSTVAVPLNLEGEAIYAASKSAVESLTKTLAKEFSQFKITVNAVGPCPIKTDLIRSVPERKLQELLEKQTVKAFGELEDVKNVIDFFISENSSQITGQIIYLGGVSA